MVFLQIEDLVAYDADKLAPVPVGRFIDPMLREVRLSSQCGAEPMRC